MAPKLTTPIFFFFLLLLLLSSSPYSSSALNSFDADAEAVSLSSPLISTIRSTLDEIQNVLSILSTVTGPIFGGDLRVSSAVQDCVDLLSLSSDELDWTLSSTSAPAAATQAAGAKTKLSVGTGHQRFDLRSWLSAALGNQETCAEGFDGTDGIVKTLVVGSLGTVTSLVYQVLSQIPDVQAGGGGGKGGNGRKLLDAWGFPTWMGPADRRLLQAPGGTSLKPNVVVAADGSGDYTTVAAAVEAVPLQSNNRFVIYVKKGVYKENVEIKKKKWNVVLVGDGMGATVISGSRSFVDGWTTYRTATLAVSGRGFIARDLTVENTAGQAKHQAVALRSDSDLSAYFRVEVTGYQDTLYAHSLRQFYRECRISGTVDFVFGNAAVVFQGCNFVARSPLPSQKNSVTAQGRKYADQNTGFSIHGCNITLENVGGGAANGTASPAPTYLGRPWKEYSRTVIMQTYLGQGIRPEGWLEWAGDFALGTLYYAEYMNYGPGSGLGGRVKWPGFHAITNPAVASNFTVGQFIDGNLWLPATGVRYTAGLSL